MTGAMTCRLLLTLVTAVAVTLIGVPSLPGHPGGMDPTAAAATAKKATYTQHVRISWSGAHHRVTSRTAVVPGIGRLKGVCRPDDAQIVLTATNRQAETQMWMAKYEHKHGRVSVAVKTVRVYRWADAEDDGTGGTGKKGSEGMNQRTPVEASSSGWMYGIISQRPGRNRPAAGIALPPVTTFELTWDWGHFHGPRKRQYCTVDLTLHTALSAQHGVDWHGVTDAAHGDEHTSSLGSRIGRLVVTCQPNVDGEQTISLRPASPKAWVYVETITGEGSLGDHVETEDVVTDPATGLVGPIDLPTNGMLRLFYTVNGIDKDLLVSSYQVLNNAARPDLDTCEVAAGSF